MITPEELELAIQHDLALKRLAIEGDMAPRQRSLLALSAVDRATALSRAAGVEICALNPADAERIRAMLERAREELATAITFLYGEGRPE